MVLYGPGDFKNDKSFMDIINKKIIVKESKAEESTFVNVNNQKFKLDDK